MDKASGDVLASNAYAYSVEIESIEIAQFAEVHGLSSSIGVIEHHESGKGGVHVMKKLPGALSWTDITLKRGWTNDRSLWNWFKDVQDGKIQGARRNASICLHDYSRKEIARYNLLACWPSKLSIGNLVAGTDTVRLEEVVLVHEGLLLA